MLRIAGLTYRIGPRVLFNQADATINAGHRVGLVGRNGAGKTTLLRLIIGELEPDAGDIDTAARWRIGVTAQEAPGGPEKLINLVLGADKELALLNAEAATATDPGRIAEIHERLFDVGAHTAPARAARILSGLGFDEAAQQRPCDEYSGGWRMRVALATLLFSQPDLLLLDEPTNHLDLEATLWLEDFLRHYSGTVLLVSHDRVLLNRAVDQILHLENGELSLYQGGYDRFERTRRMRLELDEKQRIKQNAQRDRMEKFVERFRYKATKARQAQSRLKMLARMEPVAEYRDEASIAFDFPDPKPPLAPPLYSLDDVAVGYGGNSVLDGLTLRLDVEDRIALLGANGNGKSTLIKLLAGRLGPMSGDITKSGQLRVGYFAQHQTDELDASASAVVELGRRRPNDADLALRKHLGRFGFSKERADTRIVDLSGGEKARLLFALMSADSPHILLLDEPTNHLDMVSRHELIQAVNNFKGAAVIVSHDFHLIGLTADRFWLVAGGRVDPFDGDMDDYRTLLSARDGDGGNSPNSGQARNGQNKKEQRRKASERRKALGPLKRQLAEAEAIINRLESEKTGLVDALADPALYQGDGGELEALRKQLGEVQKKLKGADESWGKAQERWDRAQAASPSVDDV